MHLRCGPAHCSAVYEMDDGNLVIIGKAAHFDSIPIGEDEQAVIIPPEYLNDIITHAE